MLQHDFGLSPSLSLPLPLSPLQMRSQTVSVATGTWWSTGPTKQRANPTFPRKVSAPQHIHNPQSPAQRRAAAGGKLSLKRFRNPSDSLPLGDFTGQLAVTLCFCDGLSSFFLPPSQRFLKRLRYQQFVTPAGLGTRCLVIPRNPVSTPHVRAHTHAHAHAHTHTHTSEDTEDVWERCCAG
jgi:hypothetical protein